MPRKHKLVGMKIASGYWMARDDKAQGLWMWALRYLMRSNDPYNVHLKMT